MNCRTTSLIWSPLNTSAVQYWLFKEPQYKQTGALAVDLVAAPASEA